MLTLTYNQSEHDYYYSGYVLKSDFSNSNRETAVYEFKASSAPLGEANAKATLGVATHILLSHAKFLLRNVNCPILLNDVGFKVF